jgi:hypothetical protein
VREWRGRQIPHAGRLALACVAMLRGPLRRTIDFAQVNDIARFPSL